MVSIVWSLSKRSTLLGPLFFSIACSGGCDGPAEPQDTSPAKPVIQVREADKQPDLADHLPGILEDSLKGPTLHSRWTQWLSQLDPKEAPARFEADGLQLGLDTLKRPSGQISVHAVAHGELMDWSEEPATIHVEMDWLEAKNASYLQMGLLLVPEGVKNGSDPRLAERNVALVFVGVPPSVNGRRELRIRKASSTVWEDLEGWPEREREGRPLGRITIELVVSDDALRLREKGRPELVAKHLIGFTKGRLLLFVSSQSNAPLRWGGFRNLRVLRGVQD